MIILVGFMGAGKTTVGQLLAEKTNSRFVDADEELERRAGKLIAEIFEDEGEERFRALEAATVASLLAQEPGVLSLGGGALEDPATRSLLSLSGATVVHLDVSTDEALARVGGDPGRPMLARSDSSRRIAKRDDVPELAERRRRGYLEASGLSVIVDGRYPAEVADVIQSASETPRVDALVGGVRRPVYVGRGSIALLGYLPAVRGAEKAFVITHTSLEDHAAAVRETLPGETHLLTVPEGESSKSIETASALFAGLSEAAAHRHDLVIGVGGGVVTDLAGFVASTYNRGMPVVHVPTTLLGMVDAAIGGKTGVNLPSGKNLVGTFHQPAAVVCDTSFLATLPAPEFSAGLAEVAKYGFIAQPDLLDVLEGGIDKVHEGIDDVVLASARIKCDVVGRDEKEASLREILNYGHTFGHAIEVSGGYGSIRHGEAVSLGMMAAAHLAHVLGRLDENSVDRHRTVLEAVGLPVRATLDIDELERAWVRDKKYRGAVRFVLLSRLGRAEPGVVAPREKVKEALERLAR